MVYRVICQECELSQTKAEYTGESSRTPYLRGREHLEGLARKCEKNPLWKHCAQFHEGRKAKFRMKVLRSHRAPLSRQIQEGVEIENSTAKIIMNSKGEWNGSRIPRVVIEVGEKLHEEENDDNKRESSKNEGRLYKKGRGEERKKRKGETEELDHPVKRRRKCDLEEVGHKSTIPECGTAQTRVSLPNTVKLEETDTKCCSTQPECGKNIPGKSNHLQAEFSTAQTGISRPNPGSVVDAKKGTAQPECDENGPAQQNPSCDGGLSVAKVEQKQKLINTKKNRPTRPSTYHQQGLALKNWLGGREK